MKRSFFREKEFSKLLTEDMVNFLRSADNIVFNSPFSDKALFYLLLDYLNMVNFFKQNSFNLIICNTEAINFPDYITLEPLIDECDYVIKEKTTSLEVLENVL